MKKEEIIGKYKPNGEYPSYYHESNIEQMLDEAYNMGIDHAIAQINELAKNYPGGKTPSGEFFTNPTRDALTYAIELISALKKPVS